MHKRSMFFALVLGTLLCGAEALAQTPDSNAAPKASAQVPSTAYRLDFSILELDDGKKINTRRYSMNLSADNRRDLKFVTRVPIQSEQGKFEYLDVGTSISARLYGERVTPLTIDVNADISSFAVPNDEAAPGGHPLLREMRISAVTAVALDKAMTIGSVDDPNSKREYQLELRVTKLQ